MKLVIKNLTKNYDEKEILKNINFSFEDGKIYGLIGKNGAGKTTLFNAINQDIEIDSGSFILNNKNESVMLSNNDIGYIPTIPVVPEFLTAKEFLKFFLDIKKTEITNLKDTDYYFSLIKINKKNQNILLKDFSHGMKVKMQLLINLLTNPKIILLDEPLTTLDIVAQEEIKDLLKILKKDHIIILSTHILELALDLCDEIIILNNKKLELIPKENLNSKKIKTKIIELLKED